MENKRILEVYKKREMRAKNKEAFFGFENPAHLFRVHERYRATLFLLKSQGYHPLSDLRILDVGCGNGNMLRQFLQWGAKPENLAGIELRPEPVSYALSLNPNLDIRCDSATGLPWPDESFDLVCQHTVFTSVLDWEIRKRIASEMARVVRKSGAILWYDFFYNNPANPDVRGVRKIEIHKLFPGFKINLQRITLAAPLTRRLVPFSWGLALFLDGLRIFNTHYLAMIRPLP